MIVILRICYCRITITHQPFNRTDVGLNAQAFTEGIFSNNLGNFGCLAMVITTVFLLLRYLKSGITTYSTIYTSTIVLSIMFNTLGLMGVSKNKAIWFSVFGIRVFGSVYTIFDGLKAVAVSDIINTIGLPVEGIMIPIFGLLETGDDNITAVNLKFLIINSFLCCYEYLITSTFNKIVGKKALNVKIHAILFMFI